MRRGGRGFGPWSPGWTCRLETDGAAAAEPRTPFQPAFRGPRNPPEQRIRDRREPKPLDQVLLQVQPQMGRHLGIRLRAVRAAGDRQSRVLDEGAELVIWRLGQQPSGEEHRAGEGLRAAPPDPPQLRFPESAIEGRIVGDQQTQPLVVECEDVLGRDVEEGMLGHGCDWARPTRVNPDLGRSPP